MLDTVLSVGDTAMVTISGCLSVFTACPLRSHCLFFIYT